PFLAPLPISLLPLPPATLQQLTWLGIRTLGAFGALPAAAVWQRFGDVGKLAHQWARGQDRRPVVPIKTANVIADQLTWEPPVQLVPPVLATLRRQLTPHLAQLRNQLQGCRGLQLTLHFADGATRRLQLQLLQPTTELQPLLWQLEAQLTTLSWPAALAEIALVVEIAELPVGQLSLFAEVDDPADSVTALAQQLQGRHGPIFYRSALVEAHHPVAERRAQQITLP
ncbi:MAG: hypothetical protein KDE31_26890, partial [Caldilineaceae bacterium]|nr:hypothetical protein [Caldilineaceae bacterium]